MNNPCALLQLGLQLPPHPTGVADEGAYTCPALTSFGFNFVNRQLRVEGDLGCAGIPPKRDECQLLRTHWSAKINRNFAKPFEVTIRKKVDQIFIGRTIQNQTMRALLRVVRRKEQYGFAKIRVTETRVRNQELPAK